jgi:enoyl-CoA hydratase/carnithine racemase
MSQLFLSIDGELAKLVLHNPPQNRLTQAFFAKLGEAIAEIGRSGARAALLSAAGPDFSFGGDIVPWPELSPQEACPEVQSGRRSQCTTQQPSSASDAAAASG